MFERDTEDAKQVWLVDADGGHARRISTEPGDHLEPQFSPDGTQIAVGYVAPEGSTFSDIAVMDPATGDLEILSDHPNGEISAVWSPDGTSILFSMFERIGYRTYALNPGSGGITRVTDGPGADWNPDPHPTATRLHLIYASSRDSPYPDACNHAPPEPECEMDIYDFAVGEDPVAITTGPDRDFAPRWSPDGRHVVFARCKAAGCLQTSLYIVGADGTGLRRLAVGGMPDWTA